MSESLNDVISSILEKKGIGLTVQEIRDEVQLAIDAGHYISNAKNVRGIVSQSLHKLNLCGCITKDNNNKWVHVKPWKLDRLLKENSLQPPQPKQDKTNGLNSDDFLEIVDLLQEVNRFPDVGETIGYLRAIESLMKKLGSIEDIIRIIVGLHTTNERTQEDSP